MIGATRRSRGSSSLKETRFLRVVGHFGRAPPEVLVLLLVDAFESLDDLVKLGDLLDVEALDVFEGEVFDAGLVEEETVVTEIKELDMALVLGDAGGREKLRGPLIFTLLIFEFSSSSSSSLDVDSEEELSELLLNAASLDSVICCAMAAISVSGTLRERPRAGLYLRRTSAA